MLLKQLFRVVSASLRKQDRVAFDRGPTANGSITPKNGHPTSGRSSAASLVEGPRREELLLFGTSLKELKHRIHYCRCTFEVVRRIESRFDHRLPLNATARACGVSPNHLNNLLKRHSGLPFHQLLIRYRLFKACEMMTRRDSSLLEIALDSGFGSVSSFEHQFKRLLGTAPRDYRKLLRS